MLTERLQANCQARQTDQQPPDQQPTRKVFPQKNLRKRRVIKEDRKFTGAEEGVLRGIRIRNAKDFLNGCKTTEVHLIKSVSTAATYGANVDMSSTTIDPPPPGELAVAVYRYHRFASFFSVDKTPSPGVDNTSCFDPPSFAADAETVSARIDRSASLTPFKPLIGGSTACCFIYSSEVILNMEPILSRYDRSDWGTCLCHNDRIKL
ncbi:hypothetical protein T265_10090 [Opisthorchis viverrini]|uniref:Uncharacterized protein n=1 Tax=Opisthorchis viverrini TaxID=6198 RepID=A0A075A2L3_OPIVI|nr:hypothetical protein T265_10090 [Opisthorchis viverrini]KER21619.1 hypothetical protein T265_10090 [Opisthorchis viverrini]